jgi:RNA polymerase sigma-70 factor (ECF subfamily)
MTTYPNISFEAMQDTREADAQLMDLVQARSTWALEILFNRYLTRGIRQARKMGLDAQASEDIVSDAFIKIWNQAEKFQAIRGSFSGWFYTIVHNLAIDEIRRMQSRSTAQMQSYFESSGSQNDDESQFSHALESIHVRAALLQLPDSQRELLQLAYVEGLSRREIAKRLALPLGTVHTRVRLGKEKLKRLLQDPKLRSRSRRPAMRKTALAAS